MEGLESRFALVPRTPPLVEVTGPATAGGSTGDAGLTTPLSLPYGPLTLAEYTWTPTTEGVAVTLTWLVSAAIPGDYTTSVQLFDAAGEKLGQDDRPPGGVYYPTSLWKPGETLVDTHMIALAPGVQPARLLIAMYTSADGALLAPPLDVLLDSIDKANQ
jgi:hypothetical protein